MLPTNRRVKKTAFPEIMERGVFLSGGQLTMKFIDKQDNLPSRFSFVVSTKVKKTAVGRHLIKRRLSTMVEKLLINTKGGFLVVFFVKNDISLLPINKVQEELILLFKKAKILD